MNVNTSIEEIMTADRLSVRASNVCKFNGLSTLFDIYNHYLLRGNFLNFENCGVKSDKELVSLCEKYKQLFVGMPSPEIKSKSLGTNNISHVKRTILDSQVAYLISQLSVRSRNGLNKMLGSKDFQAYELIDVICSETIDFKSIKNLGVKSSNELSLLRKKITIIIPRLLSLKEIELNREYTNQVLLSHFKNLPKKLVEHTEEIFDQNNKLKLFKLISLCIESDLIFNKSEKYIFNFYYKKGGEGDVEELSKTLDLTLERIRQIKLSLPERIEKYFGFLIALNVKQIASFDIESVGSIYIINDEFVQHIACSEESNYSKDFYALILRLFFPKYHIIGLEEALQRKDKVYGKLRSFKNKYLIKDEVYQAANLAEIIASIIRLIEEKVAESYQLHFEGYIGQYILPQNDEFLLYDAKQIAETILYLEFDLIVDSNGYLTIEQNTRTLVVQYVIQALEEINEMAKVASILEYLQKKYPYLNFNEQKLRSILVREKEYFIYIGRTSTYGLKKWEGERDLLRGGTIRDLAEQFLMDHVNPKHIGEIIDYIRDYRPTTTGVSIQRNLRAEENKRFIFFEGGFVGITGKRYTQKQVSFKKVLGTHFRKEILSKLDGLKFDEAVDRFCKEYSYLPVQVIYALRNRIQCGEISLNHENILKI